MKQRLEKGIGEPSSKGPDPQNTTFSADYRSAGKAEDPVERTPEEIEETREAMAIKETAETAETVETEAQEGKEPGQPGQSGKPGGSGKKSRRGSREKREKAGDPLDRLMREARELDKELDDFLPEGETLPEEEYLTKWGDDLEEEDSASEEDASLEESPEEEAPSSGTSRERRLWGKHWYGMVVGSLVLLLALTGVVSIAWTAGSALHARLTDDSHLRAYDTFLRPVVMLDPQPFESPEKADMDFVQNASLWHLILSDGGRSYSLYDDAGRAMIPLGDVTAACEELFGPGITFSPRNPQEETFYTYDSTDNHYHVALYSADSVMTPYTESSYTENGRTVLRVGYVSPADQGKTGSASVSGASETPVPVKYMEYVMELNEDTGKEYIYAIRTILE